MMPEAAPNLPGFAPVILPGLRPQGARAHIGRRGPIGRTDPNSTARVELAVYRKDVIVKMRATGLSKRHKEKPTTRGVIKGFSWESAKRLKFLIRNTADMWESFLTLTYPENFPMSGPETKRHVHAFCTWITRQKTMGKDGKLEKIAYVWILEFQKRGAPHFHFLLSGYINKDRVKRKWAEIVASQDPRHLDQGAKIEGVKNPDEVGIYMAKYMGKMDQKEVPLGFEKVGRFWGASRCLTRVMYSFDGLYREASRELRHFRKYNQSTRAEIAKEQAARAERLQSEADKCPDKRERAKLLIHARTARRASFSYAKKWRWRGHGFVLIRGAGFFRSLLKQAVGIDRGREVWKEFDERDNLPKPYIPLWERGAQFLLDGSLDPGWMADKDFRTGS